VQLIDLRNEVLACGFDATLFGSARITMYINNALSNICRRVSYYVDEATNDYSTVSGTATYSLPADFAKIRSVRDTGRQMEMASVGLRQIDQSSLSSGAPRYYAIDGSNLHLWPTPDGVYPLETRYWKLPAPLVADSDVPTIPADYHNLLIYAANAECYRAEDDHATAANWQALYDKGLAEFAADMKFENDDAPARIADMWVGEQSLSGGSWTIYGTGF
jgi:hypothetical protein